MKKLVIFSVLGAFVLIIVLSWNIRFGAPAYVDLEKLGTLVGESGFCIKLPKDLGDTEILYIALNPGGGVLVIFPDDPMEKMKGKMLRFKRGAGTALDSVVGFSTMEVDGKLKGTVYNIPNQDAAMYVMYRAMVRGMELRKSSYIYNHWPSCGEILTVKCNKFVDVCYRMIRSW